MSVIKSHIRAMSAYRPPLEGRNAKEQLLLDFNERTTTVSTSIVEALTEFARSGPLQQYPKYGNIAADIAAALEVPADQLMITNGSDQGIELIIRATCTAGDEIVIPSPSFAMYDQVAQVENLRVINATYSREIGFPEQAVRDAISDSTRCIVISNPNNPTGTAVAAETILSIARSAPHAAVLVDECYFQYTGITVKDAVVELPNLFITRTFSKTWGLPSVRFGAVISAPENIQELLKIRGPYDMNQFAVVAVKAALSDPGYMEEFVEEVLDTSKPMLEQYLTSRGIEFWPSSANFLFAFPDQPEHVASRLAAQGILVRPKEDAGGNVGLRITIGTAAQTERLIAALDTVLPQ